MSFMLVIASPSQNNQQDISSWASFCVGAKTESLKKEDGVFYINETAWLFDMQKALPVFSRVIHVANELKCQVHTFQLDDATILSRVVSCPRSSELEAVIGA